MNPECGDLPYREGGAFESVFPSRRQMAPRVSRLRGWLFRLEWKAHLSVTAPPTVNPTDVGAHGARKDLPPAFRAVYLSQRQRREGISRARRYTREVDEEQRDRKEDRRKPAGRQTDAPLTPVS